MRQHPDGVAHERLAHRGAFFIPGEGKRLAEMTYSASPTMLIIDHTEIDDSLRGTGASRKLVQAAVELARAQKVKILPLCPFARHVFEKTPEYGDVLAT